MNRVDKGLFDQYLKDNPQLIEKYPYQWMHCTGYIDPETNECKATYTTSSWGAEDKYQIDTDKYGDNYMTTRVLRSLINKLQP